MEDVAEKLEKLRILETHEQQLQAAEGVDDLLEKCKTLLSELDEFRGHLAEQMKQHTVELRQFRNNVASEVKSLERLSQQEKEQEQETERTRHALRSSNLPFYTAVWDAAKASRAIVGLGKRFYWTVDGSPVPSHHEHRRRTALTQRKAAGGSALVDVVAEDGMEWIKVSTLTERKLVFEMAKKGWEAGNNSSDDEEDRPGHEEEEDVDDQISLVRLAEDLQRASRARIVRYRHPQIRFVLPKLERGRFPETDKLLHDLEARGVTVQTASSLPPSRPVMVAKMAMAIDERRHFSQTLNIDCTILLALVSDLSHADLEPEPWFHTAIKRQIERERDEQLLPNIIWPVLGDSLMVCTAEAATRMRVIVDAIGTESEKRRTAVLMGDDNVADRVEDFQKLSIHAVPKTWNMPITIIEDDSPDLHLAGLPPTARHVAEHLSHINQSVFLYGWAAKLTTISSNRAVARAVEKAVVENREHDDAEPGPDIWLCPMARSLVGKEKNRRDGTNPRTNESMKIDDP